jgi:hypothetical protein
MSGCFLHPVSNARKVGGVHDLVRCCGDPVVAYPRDSFEPRVPGPRDPGNDSSSLVGNKGEEESLLVAEGEEDESLQL